MLACFFDWAKASLSFEELRVLIFGIYIVFFDFYRSENGDYFKKNNSNINRA